MSTTLKRWTEDETVGKALIVAGAVFLVVDLLPIRVIEALRHAWPVIVIGLGLVLLWRRPAG